MKKKVRVKQSVPFYSNEPAVNKKQMADSTMSQSASLGNATGMGPNKIIDKSPGKMSGVVGFADKHRPQSKGIGITPPQPFTKAKSPATLRMSGHPQAHRIGGGIKPIKKI